jgi:hypothetical protein
MLSRSFAPVTMMMALSPFGSTAIGATPEGASSSIATYDESMPKELKLSSVPSPKTSRPSPVTIVTRAPSLAGITA